MECRRPVPAVRKSSVSEGVQIRGEGLRRGRRKSWLLELGVSGEVAVSYEERESDGRCDEDGEERVKAEGDGEGVLQHPHDQTGVSMADLSSDPNSAWHGLK